MSQFQCADSIAISAGTFALVLPVIAAIEPLAHLSGRIVRIERIHDTGEGVFTAAFLQAAPVLLPITAITPIPEDMLEETCRNGETGWKFTREAKLSIIEQDKTWMLAGTAHHEYAKSLVINAISKKTHKTV